MVWHRIVQATGFRTVAEAKRDIRYSEYLDWCAFFQARPWGEAAALQAWATFAATGKAQRGLSVADFMPKQRKVTTVQQFRDNLRAYRAPGAARRG